MRTKARKITTITLKGFNNCFSMRAIDGKEYRIVNFYYEEIEKLKHLFPVTIDILGKGIAIIDDCRIDNNLYSERYCEVCCPERLLPDPQKRAIDRLRRNGTLTEKQVKIGDDMFTISSMKVEARERKLKSKWTLEASEFIYSDYIPIMENNNGV